MTAALSDLIAKLEKVDEGSRELDFYVARIAGWHGSDDYQKCSWLAHPDDVDGSDSVAAYPRYTSSIDHALTLVPEGWLWRLDHAHTVPHYCEADLWGPIAEPKQRQHYISRGGRTMAIALCVACLRARAA